MQWQLLVERGKHAGRRIPLTSLRFEIGRDDACHLRANSDLVSRRHCSLYLEGGRLFVSDCHATNGTFVNDTRLFPELPVELNPGDRLAVGPLVFVIDATADLPDDPADAMAAEMLLAMEERPDDPEDASPPPASPTSEERVMADTDPAHPGVASPDRAIGRPRAAGEAAAQALSNYARGGRGQAAPG